jgi:hypothetical protein
MTTFHTKGYKPLKYSIFHKKILIMRSSTEYKLTPKYKKNQKVQISQSYLEVQQIFSGLPGNWNKFTQIDL